MAREWSDETLDELRTHGDPLADATVAAVLASGEVASINALLRRLAFNVAPVPAELPEPVRDYFAQVRLPAWAEPKLIVAGEQLFLRYGLQALQNLLYRALPECYAMASGVEVLHRTRQMAELTHQRVMETLHFTIDVMAPGGLGAFGRGVRSAQRVRLVHAAIRAHLRDGWDPALGVPINQEDMLATLGSFSTLVVDGVTKLGVDLDRDEQRAYLHCWKVVGALIGVREELLIDELDDGLALWDRIRARHHRRSEAGVVLTRALLEFADELVPGEWLDGLNPSMLRLLCGDEVADLLEVPPADWTRHIIRQYTRLVALADDLQDLGRVTAWLGERLGATLVRSLLGKARAGDRPDFAIPASLREHWGV